MLQLDSEQATGVPEREVEWEALPRVNAVLRWLPRLYSRQEITQSSGEALGCGVYIAVDIKARHLPLKVGVAAPFKTRMAHSTYVKMEAQRPGLRFYLANILRGGRSRCGIGGIDKAVENAIARTLLRAGHFLPEHGTPIVPAEVLGSVRIYNLLPGPLRHALPEAYQTRRPNDARGKPIIRYPALDPASNRLTLEPATHPQWET